ncbi:MAG: hypothetical protein M3340_05520 [Actinomycetota bacterium]|nr:hypothetical protein [Actinomycetota bacterium]
MSRPVLYALIAVATLLLALVASQLLVPAYLERRAENRLTEHGGEAKVDIDALPALRLLFNDGKRIRVSGERLDIPLEGERGKVFDDLDRFADAHVRLDQLTAGPLRIKRFTLTRAGHERPYNLAVSATVTAAELGEYAGQQFGPLAGFLGRLGTALLPASTAPIPVELDASLVSDDGLAIVETVDGTVAGIPADPLVAALASAIAKRL